MPKCFNFIQDYIRKILLKNCFNSDDLTQIELRKAQILSSEWERTKYLAEKYISKNGKIRVRNGLPLYCSTPAQIDKN